MAGNKAIGISIYELVDQTARAFLWTYQHAQQPGAQDKATAAIQLVNSVRADIIDPMFIKLVKAGGYELIQSYQDMRGALDSYVAAQPVDTAAVLHTLRTVLTSLSNIVRCYKVIYTKDDSPMPIMQH